MERLIEELTVINPQTGYSFTQRFADMIRSREYLVNMTKRGYIVTSKAKKARKHEISIQEYRDGKRRESLEY